MAKYFSSHQTLACFERLASSKTEGKTALERTSGLMYFLAFEAASKNAGELLLDLNPDKIAGIHSRKAIELEFTKLVLVRNSNGIPYQVYELGKVAKGGTTPEKRISSNFFTVPLKKASEQLAPYHYPKRPVPLMNLGQAATGVKWGISRHANWEANLPRFFSEITGSTFFTDLAVFVARDTPIPDPQAKNCVDALAASLEKKFPTDLFEFWMDRIRKEQVLTRHLANPFCDVYEPMLEHPHSNEKPFDEGREDSKSRIAYLEGLLRNNGIDY